MQRIKVGQRWLNAIIDTGATINVIGEKRLESVGPQPNIEQSDTRIYSYGATSPLPTMGKVVIEVQWDGLRLHVEFQVVLGQSDTIIGYATAVVLRLVTVNRPRRQERGRATVRDKATMDRRTGEKASEWCENPGDRHWKKSELGLTRPRGGAAGQARRW